MAWFLNFLIPIPHKFPEADSSFEMYIARASLRSPPIVIKILVVWYLREQELEFNDDCNLRNLYFVLIKNFVFPGGWIELQCVVSNRTV